MEKVAAKKSTDPLQQKLRDNKAAWNKACSALIARIIAAKKGLNGKGDAKFSLPPSSIKDPVPELVGAMLHQLSSDFERIVGGANTIISEQEAYSHNRRKKQPKKPQEQMQPMSQPERIAILQAALVKQGSNRFSRFWAYFKGYLPFTNKEYKEYRLGLLKSVHILDKDLSALDETVLVRNIKLTPSMMKAYSTIGSDIGVLNKAYNNIKKLQDTAKMTKIREDKEKAKAEQSQGELSDGDEDNEPKIFLRDIKDDLLHAKELGVSSIEIGNLIGSVDDAIEAEESNSKNFSILNEGVILSYENLINILRKKIKAQTGQDIPAKTVAELAKKYNEIVEIQNIKNANAFTRWIKRNIHKATPFQITSAFRLDISSQIKDVKKITNKLMDSLEKTIDLALIKETIFKLDEFYKSIDASISALLTIYKDQEFNKSNPNMKKQKNIMDNIFERQMKKDYEKGI